MSSESTLPLYNSSNGGGPSGDGWAVRVSLRVDQSVGDRFACNYLACGEWECEQLEGGLIEWNQFVVVNLKGDVKGVDTPCMCLCVIMGFHRVDYNKVRQEKIIWDWGN